MGIFNIFFGSQTGYSNSVGNGNSFFGHIAGFKNRDYYNSFMAMAASHENVVVEDNAFLAGLRDTAIRLVLSCEPD